MKNAAGITAVSLAVASGTAKATEYDIMKLVPLDPNASFSCSRSINNGGVVVHMAKTHQEGVFKNTSTKKTAWGQRKCLLRSYLIYSGRARHKPTSL